MDGMLLRLDELLKSGNIFLRNRKKIKTRSQRILLYRYHFSIRKYRIILYFFEEISHEAISKCYHKVEKTKKLIKDRRDKNVLPSNS